MIDNGYPSEKRARLSRPIYISVVFWGEAYRDQFATMLLPTLLAPGNLPAINDVLGSKLILCTTREDWDALYQLPLFKSMASLIEPVHIEIPFPAPGMNKYLHNSFAFKLAIHRCWHDRAYASLLSPDVVLSDGTFAYLRSLAERGIDATLAPALRFEKDLCLSALLAGGFLAPNQPIVASGRQLSSIAQSALHSEIRRFEWTSPYFCRQPISVFWRLAGENGLLIHTTSWAMALVNFGALSSMRDESLNSTTLDGVFIFENFFRFLEDDRLHLVTDTDEMFLLPLTGESEMTFLPLQPLFMNRIPLIGAVIKFWGLQLFMGSSTFDKFRRWAVTIPTFIHAGSLSDADKKLAVTTSSLLHRAIVPPGRLLKLYTCLPTLRLCLSYVALLYKNPGEFFAKSWRRITGQRRKHAISSD